MKYKVKALIFDFDLTLVESRPISAKARDYLFEKHNVRFDYAEESILWGRTYKINSIDAKQASDTKLSALEIEEMFIEQAAIYYQDTEIVAEETLKKLARAGIKLCIVSGNTKENINRVLNNPHNKEVNFSLVYETNSGHTKKERIIQCLDELNIDKDEAIYIGDHINDITSAKEAGVISCAVCTGFHTKDEFSELKFSTSPVCRQAEIF